MKVSNYQFISNNPIVSIANKPKCELTRGDLLKIITELGIERITFHYVASDGKIRELRFPVQNRYQTEMILADGERLDGSSIYKGIVEAGNSDLYVVPVYKSVFLNPFDAKSLDFFCHFFDSSGEPANFTHENILLRAIKLLKNNTGLDLKALGELEFYIIFELENRNYILSKQQGYHSAPPFAKTTSIVNEMMSTIANINGNVKYGHNEVGFIESLQSELPQLNGKAAEQVEIEFLLTDVEELASQLVISTWIIRNIANKYGALATFFPKIDPGHAGNGLHFHLALYKNGKNTMLNPNNELSNDALKLIGGLCKFAPSLTAFGNTVYASYLRLVPGQEAPTKVFWSKSNRNAMIRVPLAWSNVSNLAMKLNPQQKEKMEYDDLRQTVELRTPDGSAYVFLILAGIALAVEWGLSNSTESLDLAKKYNFITDSSDKVGTETLSSSCVESAEILLRNRSLFERDGIFPPSVIEYYVKLLFSENDRDLNLRLISLSEEERIKELSRLMHRSLFKC
ncbi:MAG: glutamine synthetase beta-grasp domain-containing protein [Candidatus Kapaibacteriales bacterium]